MKVFGIVTRSLGYKGEKERRENVDRLSFLSFNYFCVEMTSEFT